MEYSTQFFSSYKCNKSNDKEDIFDLVHWIESSNYDIVKCEKVLGIHSLTQVHPHELIGLFRDR